MARSAVCTSPPHHRGATRLGDGTTSLCHLHPLVGPHHHLQLNLAKTELMVFPAKQVIHHNININIDSLSLVPSKTARNLWVIIDDQLTFTDQIASVSRSCRFALFNIRKIRPYLTQYATQLLVQTLVNSRLDYCNALLTGLPACVV